jgi:hypothetical protein
MTINFGNGVSRTLTPEQRNFLDIVFQRGKPPIDADFNFSQQILSDQIQQAFKGLMPSGFILDPTRSNEDYITSKEYSNMFMLGNSDPSETTPIVHAFVNGWFVPVSGTNINSEINCIKLYPPPATDSRIDFVFLEVWQSLISPNPSTINKPSSSTIWKYGNVEYGGTNIDDDLIDPTIGREVTKRIQLQYRIRVFGQGHGLGSSVSLAAYPDGLDDPNILGQGNSTTPVGGYVFSNMKDVLGDPGLWRAGDGASSNSLGTADGYVYAVPICAIFRRNSSSFSSFSLAGASNNNGGYNRNPSASFLSNPRNGAKELSTPSLPVMLSHDFIGDILVDNLVDSGMDDPVFLASNKYLKIGSEIVKVSSIDVGTNTITISERGRGGTNATSHVVGTELSFVNSRPDGLFSDEISDNDILDLRHAINPGDWDYDRLLQHNFSTLLRNELKTSWKNSATGDSQGVLVTEVDLLHADGSVAPPPDVEVLDGPDGIRTIWSDASVIQFGVTALLDPAAPKGADQFTTTTFDVSTVWDIGANFNPTGFINNAVDEWSDGSSIFLYLDSPRETFRDSATRAVRFVSPKEYWKEKVFVDLTLYEEVEKQYLNNFSVGNQNPVKLNMLGYPFMNAPYSFYFDQGSPGYFYPLKELNFECPFIFLGGLLHGSLKTTFDANAAISASVTGEINNIDIGIDFDTSGVYWGGNTRNILGTSDYTYDYDSEIDDITSPLLNGRTTLRKLMTNGYTDRTGNSSEVYVVLWGDTVSGGDNNGVFRVIGVGTTGQITDVICNTNTSIMVTPVGNNTLSWAVFPTIVNCEFRSQYTTQDDGSAYPGIAAAVISLTDSSFDPAGRCSVTGENYWYGAGGNATYPASSSTFDNKMMVSLSLLYNKDRSGFARIPYELSGIYAYESDSNTLRQGLGELDSTIVNNLGLVADNEYPASPVTMMLPVYDNGLDVSGEVRPFTKDGFRLDEQKISTGDLRDSECFYDKGSKTLVYRPYRKNNITLKGYTNTKQKFGPPPTIFSFYGTYYGMPSVPIDPAGLFSSAMGYAIPNEFMPKFGRLDIPYRYGSDSNFLSGINHLFCDSTDPTNAVFNIIGGEDNTSGGNLVTPIYFQTGSTSGHSYGDWGTIAPLVVNAYQARLTTDIGLVPSTEADELKRRLADVGSEDVGFGLSGIQLPPWIGIARLYGVYERNNFLSKGGKTFQADRITPEIDPAINLLKTDADKQTLYIFKDGALDVNLRYGDHTYIVPSNIVDISKIPDYTPTDKFTDFEYVVECTVFGFPYMWINGSNYVMSRVHDGAGTAIIDGVDLELEYVPMILNSPAPLNSRVYSIYSRIPYQGDVYMTRNVTSRVTSDYENRYGGIDTSDAYELRNEIQQYDSDGDSLIQTPNPRSFEILSSIDFYTTLGTGNIGGELRPGTILDVCHPEVSDAYSTRIPNSVTAPSMLMETRAFTEGQKLNKNRAYIDLVFRDITVLEDASFDILYDEAVGNLYYNGGYSSAAGVRNTAVAGFPSDYEFQIGATIEDTVDNLETSLNAVMLTNLRSSMYIEKGIDRIRMYSYFPGSKGNDIKCVVNRNLLNLGSQPGMYFISGTDNNSLFSGGSRFSMSGITRPSPYRTLVKMGGGVDLINNAGNGSTRNDMVGITERLPLGILLQDSDFICEDILNNGNSSLVTYPSKIIGDSESTTYSDYNQILGGVGQTLAMSDGAILTYTPYSDSTPTGTRRFRLYRGGGSVFISSGKTPGGPVDISVESISKSDYPVLKGGVLYGKAFLVRNFKETVFGSNATYGDELQMLIVTYGKIGNGKEQTDGLNLSGSISPTGYGEGYAAADRYRLESRPLIKSFSRSVTDPITIALAKYSKSRGE